MSNIALIIARVKANHKVKRHGCRFVKSLLIDPLKSFDFSKFLPGLGMF